MVFNTTYTDNKVRDAIHAKVGPSIPFLQRLRMKGIGSRRMIIKETSDGLLPFINEDHLLTYSSIEIRTNGILVHMTQGLRNYSWAIPFYTLAIFHTEHFTVHSQGEFVRYRDKDAAQHAFFKKLMAIRLAWLERYAMEPE